MTGKAFLLAVLIALVVAGGLAIGSLTVRVTAAGGVPQVGTGKSGPRNLKALSYMVLNRSETAISVHTLDLSSNGDLLAIGGIAVTGANWAPPRVMADWQSAVSLLPVAELSKAFPVKLQGSSWTHEVEFSRQARFLAVALDREGRQWPVLEILAVPSMERVAEFQRDWVGFQFVSEDALVIATGDPASPLKLWDFKRGSIVREAPPTHGPLRGTKRLAVDLHSGLAALSWEDNIQIWSLSNLEPVARFRHEPDGPVIPPRDLTAIPEDKPRPLVGYEDIQSLQFTPDGRWLASVRDRYATLVRRHGNDVRMEPFSKRAHLKFWDPSSGKLVRSLECPGPLRDMDFSPDGRWIAVASSQMIHILDTTNGSELLTLSPQLEGNAIGLSGVRVSPNGNEIFAVSGDGVVHVWKIQAEGD